MTTDGLENLGIGTNGKGRNKDYSLASGYGEFMERLQNRILFDNYRFEEIGKQLDFVYAPDEEFWNKKQMLNNCSNILKKSYKIDTNKELTEFVNNPQIDESQLMLPFYSVFDNKLIMLPYQLLLYAVGSNGMAAGNTNEEAITQGICEIFERYVLRKIFTDAISLPTIPNSYYDKTNIDKAIKKIESEDGYKIIVKDCSLGLGLPVVGVLVLDTQHGLYNFNIGADCNPLIAIERCLTELYQNSNDIFETETDFAGIYNDSYQNIQKCVINGSGHWPISIMLDGNDFDMNTPFFMQQIENDLQYCVSLVKKLGFNIYIRNNSFLKFPAFHIIIPGMSELIISHKNIFEDSSNASLFELIRNLDKLSFFEYQQLSYILDKEYETLSKKGETLNSFLPANTDDDLKNLDLNLFSFMLHYRIGEYNNALNYLEYFLKDKSKTTYIYFFCAKNFVKLFKIKGLPINIVIDVLSKCYGESLANEVSNDLADNTTIFKYYNLPSCPKCDVCKLKKSCKYDTIIQIEKKLNKLVKNASINQSSTSKLFNSISY